MRNAFAIVAKLGERLQWRDQKALVLLVANSGPWEAAGQLADALGIGPDLQEAIYHESAAARSDPTLPDAPPLGELTLLRRAG